MIPLILHGVFEYFTPSFWPNTWASPRNGNLNLLVRIKFLNIFYRYINKNWKIDWSEQSFTGARGPVLISSFLIQRLQLSTRYSAKLLFTLYANIYIVNFNWRNWKILQNSFSGCQMFLHKIFVNLRNFFFNLQNLMIFFGTCKNTRIFKI